MSEKKDLKKKDEAMPPARVTGNGPAGFDDFDDGDIKMPRLAILQALSEQVTEGNGKMGQLANTVTKEILGDSVEIIPLFMFKTRVQFEIGKGLVMMSRDNQFVTMGKDGFEQYIGQPVDQVPGAAWTGKTPPSFHVVYNYPVVIVTQMGSFPLMLSLMRTGAKAAKDLNSMAKFSNEDMFAQVYNLHTIVDKNDKGSFALPKIQFVRKATDEEYATAGNFFKSLYHRKEDIDVDLTTEEPLAKEGGKQEEF